jgi:N-acetylmuramoyl-L-alanine amidase
MTFRIFCAFLIPFFIALPSHARDGGRDSSFILLVVPETDTVTTSSSKYRFSASTIPGNTVTVNGKGYKVYPSGAFVGLLDLQIGENPFVIAAVNDSGQTVERQFLIVRNKPIETSRVDSVMIDETMMEPQSDMWLGEGDVLETQIKGTPGCVATFLGGRVMHEVPRSEAGGLEGVYRGSHKVSGSDSLQNHRLSFRLESRDGRVAVAHAQASISFLPRVLPLVGITKGDRVYLDIGLGEDRLGGAKFAFMQEGIRLAISGKVNGRYRVKLTDNQEAWIPDDQVDLQPPGTHLPYSLTGNWSVAGDAKFDVVTISLSEKLPYSTFQELEPTRIHVDVYGAVSNSNWITQQLTTKEIKNVYYTQVAKQQFRITIELNHKQIWGYDIRYRGNSLVIRVKRQPEKLKLGALTFVLDAGHGGTNKGALGSTGALEKDVTLSFVQHLKTFLEGKGAKVVLTRSRDTSLSTIDRLKTIWSADADLLVSLHANSVGLATNPEDVKGTATFYKHICFRPLSLFILKRLMKTGLASFGNVGSFNFGLNAPTELPNVLVETAFMSNPEDEMKLLDPEFQQSFVKQLGAGIQDFLDSCEE